MKILKFYVFNSCLLLALAGCQSSPKSSDEISLKFNLKKGTAMKVETQIDQNIITKAQGQKMNIDQKMQFVFDLAVEDIDPQNNFIVKNTYRRVAMQQNIPGIGENVVDTDHPEASKGAAVSIMEPLFKTLIGKSIKMTMTPRGKILSMDMSEIQNLAGTNEFNESNGLSELFIEYPEKPVKPGDTWECEREIKGKIPMWLKAGYTLKEVKDGVAFIGVQGSYTSADEKMQISGTTDGVMEVDVATGWTRRCELNQKMDMRIQQTGLEMPMNMESRITINTL